METKWSIFIIAVAVCMNLTEIFKYIFKIFKFIFKSFLSVIIIALPILIGSIYFPTNTMLSIVCSILTFVGIWVVLNYTLPEEIVEFIVAILLSIMLPRIYLVVIKAAPEMFYYPVRSKRRRFNI
jgi:hypothetical protein